jgi:hypothetical protein
VTSAVQLPIGAGSLRLVTEQLGGDVEMPGVLHVLAEYMQQDPTEGRSLLRRLEPAAERRAVRQLRGFGAP